MSTFSDDSEAAAQLDEIQAAVRQLRALLPPLPPDYEYSDPLTFGGQQSSGVLRLDNPYRTPCEYTIAAWAFGGSGAAALSRDPNPVAPALTASSIDPSIRSRAIVAISGQAQYYPADSQWFPLQGTDSLYLAITAGGNVSVYVTLQFRRLQDRRGVYTMGAEQ